MFFSYAHWHQYSVFPTIDHDSAGNDRLVFEVFSIPEGVLFTVYPTANTHPPYQGKLVRVVINPGHRVQMSNDCTLTIYLGNLKVRETTGVACAMLVFHRPQGVIPLVTPAFGELPDLLKRPKVLLGDTVSDSLTVS